MEGGNVLHSSCKKGGAIVRAGKCPGGICPRGKCPGRMFYALSETSYDLARSSAP